jgi:hypothetical protein
MIRAPICGGFSVFAFVVTSGPSVYEFMDSWLILQWAGCSSRRPSGGNIRTTADCLSCQIREP